MEVEPTKCLERPRIVFAAPRIPYPLNTGLQQRMFHILTALTKIGDVDLVCYAETDQTKVCVNLEPLKRLCRTVDVLPLPKVTWRHSAQSYRGVLERYIFSTRPFSIAEFPGGRLAEHVSSLAQGADLIWVARLYVAEWIGNGRDRMIVDLDDIECVKRARLLDTQANGAYQSLVRFDNFKLKIIEKLAAAKYAAIAVCSEQDRGFFPRRYADRVLVVPNGIPKDLVQPPLSAKDSSLVLVGNMRYRPNVDAAFWFVREIFPIIVNAAPQTHLYIVGHDDHHWVRPLDNGRTITVTGSVSDVAPYVTRSQVSVVPVRIGGGTRIKILESLALGIPVVSTTVGAEGLDLIPGRHVQIADSPEAFAAKVLDLLGNSTLRAELSEAGQKLVMERYTWEGIGKRLSRQLKNILPSRTSGSHASSSDS